MTIAPSEQATHGAAQALAFEEQLVLLLDRKEIEGENRRLKRLLKLAQLKIRSATIEDLDYRSRHHISNQRVNLK